METNEPDNTIKEILEEDRTHTRRRRRGRGCLLRLLIIAALLFMGFYGFVLFRQKMLDIEAEALIYAKQTLTMQAAQPSPEASTPDSATLKQPLGSQPTGQATAEPGAATPLQPMATQESGLPGTPNP